MWRQRAETGRASARAARSSSGVLRHASALAAFECELVLLCHLVWPCPGAAYNELEQTAASNVVLCIETSCSSFAGSIVHAVRGLLPCSHNFDGFSPVQALPALGGKDVWAAVVPAEQVVAIARRQRTIAIVAPASGTALSAMLWVSPQGHGTLCHRVFCLRSLMRRSHSHV